MLSDVYTNVWRDEMRYYGYNDDLDHDPFDEDRADTISQNGNEGLHYNVEYKGHRDMNCPVCKTPMKEAKGIAIFCPNRDCEVFDGPDLYNADGTIDEENELEFMTEGQLHDTLKKEKDLLPRLRIMRTLLDTMIDELT